MTISHRISRLTVLLPTLFLLTNAVAQQPARSDQPATQYTITEARVGSETNIRQYREMLTARPEDPVLLNNLGVEYALTGRLRQAAETLERAIAAAPLRADLLINLALVYRDLGRTTEAWGLLDRSVRLAPKDPRPRTALCDLLLLRYKPADAVECYRVLESIGPLDPVAATNFSQALLNSGEIGPATKMLEDAARRFPGNSWVLNGLGMAQFRQKKYELAANSFKTAIEIDPQQNEFRFNLALAQLARRNRPGAISQYRLIQGSNAKLAFELYKRIYGDKVVFVGTK